MNISPGKIADVVMIESGTPPLQKQMQKQSLEQSLERGHLHGSRPSRSRLHQRATRRKKTVQAMSRLWGQLSSSASALILAALIFLLPLIPAPAFSRRWHGLSAALAEAGGAALLALLLWHLSHFSSKQRLLAWLQSGLLEWLQSGPLPWLLGLLLWSSLSSLFAADKRFALTALLQLGTGILVCAAAAGQSDSRRREMLLDMLTAAVLLSSLIAAFLMLTSLDRTGSSLVAQNKHVVVSAQTHRGRMRTQMESSSAVAPSLPSGGTLGDPRLLSSFLTLCLPLLLAVAGSPTNIKRRRLTAGLAVAAAGAALALTGAFVFAWPGLAAGLAALLLPVRARHVLETRLRNPPRSRSRSPKPSWRTPLNRVPLVGQIPTLTLLIGLAAVLVLAWLLPRTLRNLSVLSPPAAWTADAHVARRGAVQILAQRPWLGYGPGSYTLVQQPWTHFGHTAGEVRAGGAGLTEQAQSFYLQMAAEVGLPGLLLWLGALAAFFQTGIRTLKSLPEASQRRPLLLGAMAGVAAQIADGLLSPSWQYGQTQFFLWLMLGIGIACAGPATQQLPATRQPLCSSAGQVRRIGVSLLTPLLLTLIAWMLPLLPAVRR